MSLRLINILSGSAIDVNLPHEHEVNLTFFQNSKLWTLHIMDNGFVSIVSIIKMLHTVNSPLAEHPSDHTNWPHALIDHTY